MWLWALIATLFTPAISFAAFQYKALASDHVIYFGGYRSTQANMRCWSEKVQAEGFKVSALPYPSGASSGLNRDIENTSEYRALLSEIRNNPNKKFKVAGHSSGSQYANNLVEWMLRQGIPAQNIELTNLDGFRASQQLARQVKTVCWSARNGSLVSRNYSPDCKVYQAPQCQTAWCLHFSVVNTAVPGDLGGGSDFIRRGYANNNCQTNMGWIQGPSGRQSPAGQATPSRR